MRSRLAFVGGFLVFLATSFGTGGAALAADPPGRVGRLSLVEGTVSLRSPQPVNADAAADNAAPELKDEWAPAALNYPVTSGNSLWTESGAKAEVQVGPAELRLNEQTELEVLRLDDRSVDLALHQGTANIHIGDTMPGGLLVDTPRGPVTLTRPGSYRIDVDTGGDSDTVQVTAFDGEAKVSVETPDRTDTHTVARGQSLKLAGEPVQIALADARATAFDDWARSRDPRAVAAQPRTVVTGQPAPRAPVSSTVSPVSTQMTGYQDLAPYGSWEVAPDYGTVWYPATVTPEWAPYRYGHWAYVAPWGWTWIDDAPWGFTPFHYGRWVRVGPRWAWWPGHRTVRPVYAPALVAFVGGNGWSLSIGSGRARPVGWVPLAPYEVYRPHYRTSATYVRNVNITTVNKTVINNITVNNNNTEINRFTNRNAVTAVSADTFARGRKVNEAKIDVSRKEIERARATNDVRAIRPQQVAVKADQPRPTTRNENGRDEVRREERRAPNPAITSREPNRGNERRDPAIERRNAAIQAAPQNRSQERNQPREQRRDVTSQPAQQAAPQQRDVQERQQRDQGEQQQRRQRDEAQERQRRDAQDRQQREEAQGRQRREQAEQQQRTEQQQRQQRDQAQEQQRQRDVEERQQRDQAEQQQRRQRDEAQNQQRREQQEQRQRRDRQTPEQRSEQPVQPQQNQPTQNQADADQQRRQAQEQQRQALEQQKRDYQDRMIKERQKRAEQDNEQAQRENRQRDAEEQQRRQNLALQRQQAEQQQQRQAEQQQRRAQADQEQQRQVQERQRRQQGEAQQRQQAEQQQRAQQEQQRQAQEHQRRQQAEAQQRQQVESQQRQQAEQQQRAQAEQQRQQRQAQEQQQQRAQQDQQRQEQARDEQRRRNPDGGRPDGKRNRDG